MPVRRGGRLFTEGDGAVYARDEDGGEPRLVFEPDPAWQREGLDVRGVEVSPDGRWIAFGLGPDESPWTRYHVAEVSTGQVLADRVENLASNVVWSPDSRGFYYVRFSREDQRDERSDPSSHATVLYHEVGDDGEDRVVFARPDRPDWIFDVTPSADGSYLVVEAREGGGLANRVFVQELRPEEGATIELVSRADATHRFLASRGSRLWLYTTSGAPRGRVVAVELDRPGREHWEEVVPEMAEAVAGNSVVGGNAIAVRGGRIVVMVLRHNQPLVRIFDLEGELQHEVDLPNAGSIWGGFAGAQDDPDVYYELLGATDPGTVYRLDVRTGTSTVHCRPNLPAFSPDDYTTRQVFFDSADGTRVPMLVTHRRDLEPDGERPAWIYAFGARGWVSFQWFQPRMIAWYDLGGVYATPGVRGGGEYGESWHRAGIGTRKQSAIDDYVAAAEWLVEEGYSRPGRIVANGDGLGGPLAAAAAMQRPDIFGAAITSIGPLDLLRHHVHTDAWRSELGTAEVEDEFRALHAYSPYHNVEASRPYPPMLVHMGELDGNTLAFHGYKLVAAMQHGAAAARGPTLLQVSFGTGHGHGTTEAQENATWTDWLAFAAASLGIDVEEPAGDG